MKKPMSRQRKRWTLVLVVVLLVTATVLYVVRLRPQSSATPTAQNDGRVTITTDDGIQLAATEQAPVRNVTVPAVILLHGYGKDRHEWDGVMQKFVDAGIHTISVDMRGFGESPLAQVPADQQVHLAQLPNDLHAIIAHLEAQPSVDASRISIIGIGVGADVAYVAAGSNLDIYRAVMIAPARIGTALDGHDVASFAPTGILGVVRDVDQVTIRTLLTDVRAPKDELILSGVTSDTDLLQSTELITSSITWITQ
jgi:pimeloyl-ACP methyl ester carboxylesterase